MAARDTVDGKGHDRTEMSGLAFLDPAEAGTLAPYLEQRVWPAGAVLSRAGDPCTFMGFLEQGRLAVKKETEFRGKHIIIAVLDPGAMVGEGMTAGRGLHGTTVTVLEECRLRILTADRFRELLRDHPGLGATILQRVIHILSLRLRRAGDRLAQIL
ncbi:MAG: cyclic nucleotide-binding domain-containing protein [Desulfobacterales bacterium]|nr:cyclic nucleotide-binding domain-containing protein [Desulfobacterales bacterium]